MALYAMMTIITPLDLRRGSRDFMYAGQSVMYAIFNLRPRLTLHTALLWSAPVLLLLVAGLVIFRASSRAPAAGAAGGRATPTSSAEQQRLDELLKQSDACGAPTLPPSLGEAQSS